MIKLPILTYISLGSNQGHKFEQLQLAIDAIHYRVGAVQRISPVYQTPAMGFEGDDFLNAVIAVHTRLKPGKLLKELLSIEKDMGRRRKKTEGYTSRPIDLDILYYGGEIKETKTLKIPHPHLQKRSFVLKPLNDLAPELEHPVLKKTTQELLGKLADEPIERLSKWLRNPRKDWDLSKFSYIAIEGNIGAGKTSLATQMATEFNAKLILERFKDNPFLPKFYQDQNRYAFPLEMSFLADRYQQLAEDITQYDLFKDCVIADYDVYKSLIFAQVTLVEEEYELFKKLFHLMHKELPKPDVYVYLYQETDQLLKNIKKRGRSYEKTIEGGYLDKINQGYLDYIKQQHQDNIKIVDLSGRDLVENRSDYLWVLEQIRS